MSLAKPEKLKAKFTGLQTVRSEGPDGVMRLYHYHRLSRSRIHAEPGTPEFEEEYTLVTKGYKTLAGRRTLAARRDRPPSPTNVYFIRAEITGLIKVGKAIDVTRRLWVLQTGSSEPLHLIGSVRDTSGGLLERAIHRDFAAERVRGEWFKASDALLALIERLCPATPNPSPKDT